MAGQVEVKSPYEAFYYYTGQLQAVQSGRWKLHLQLKVKWKNFRGDSLSKRSCTLYHLKADIGETKKLAGEYPVRGLHKSF